MKLWNRIKYRRLLRLVLDICDKNDCSTCPSSYKCTNGATGCHGAQFLFGTAAKTYSIPKSAMGLDDKKKEEGE